MERPSTPPPAAAATSKNVPQRTPEQTRRIEESRLKAKALREQYIAAQAAASSQTETRTPAGFLASDLPTTRKRALGPDLSNVPETSRDARLAKDDGIQPARKFRKYVDHDFSKMTDTKGGFLAAEDDPWNKAMCHNKEGEKPAHMTLKEWETLQLKKSLRNRREGPYEPGIGPGARESGKKCRDCGSLEIDWQWEEVFATPVCHRCKEKFPDKYSLLTKTECKTDYLITDEELNDPKILRHLNKPNPHKSHWHDMMLFLRFQVEEFAFGDEKWGSPEALDAEFEKRESDKKKRKEDKFKSKLKELKKKTRTEAFRRNNAGGGGKQFGDRIGGQGRHEHEWGQTVTNADGMSVKTCTDCGMEVEELEF